MTNPALGAVQRPVQSQEAAPAHAAEVLVDAVYAFRFPPLPGVDLGTAFRQAAEESKVGGDLIDVYQFNTGSIAISIADISGKGLHAATRAASVKHALRAYVSAGFTPAQVMRNLNVLYMNTSKYDMHDLESFVTVFLGVIDSEHRVMTYASAGHECVALVNADGATLLPPTGPLIGVFEDGHGLFHQRLVSLEAPGTTLVVTTDGVSEARSADGTFFIESSMMDHVEKNRARSALDQANSLLDATLAFCGQMPRDDIAIVVARFN
jgi:sigma-B regulation protein RsbU (phosphoserine phosphatase)